mgnify:CR=1 FL=1
MKNNIRINVIVNIIRTTVLTFISFITFPWVCRYLQESAVGLYSWATTFVAYFLILAKIGIPNLAIRECVKVRDDKEKLSNKAQAFFILQCFATIASFILMSIVVFSVPALREAKSLIFILAINFLSGCFSFEWIFIALEKQFYMSVRSIISLTLSAILIVVFVKSPNHLLVYALFTVGVTITTTIANLLYVGKFISLKKTMPYKFKQYARPLLVLCTLSLLISLYNQTDTFILGFLDPSKVEVASYSVGVKGVDIIVGIVTALSTVFIPRAAYYYEKEDKRFFNNLTKYSFNICLFIVIPAIVTMTVLAEPICGLISGSNYSSNSSTFESAPYILITLSAMMLTYSLGDIIYGQILLPMKKEKYYMWAIGIGTLSNIILSIVLGTFVFKENPSIGVAIGTIATDVCVLLFLFLTNWKWVKKALFNKNTLKLLIGNAAVLVVSILVKFVLSPVYGDHIASSNMVYMLDIIITVAVGLVIYLVVLGLLKEDLVYSFIRKKNENEE